MNELITSDQLAEELGVKPQTVRLWRTKTRKGHPSGRNGLSSSTTLFGTTD